MLCCVQRQLGFLHALEIDGSTSKSKVVPVPLFEGINSIGRDDLVSASKQVSRKHVSLKASPDGSFELSVVRLPCHFPSWIQTFCFLASKEGHCH